MKTMIAVPCMDMVPTDFMRSCLSLRAVDEIGYTFAQASLVYDGRNRLADAAIRGGWDRVLWLDSDMAFDPDLLERLSADLDEGREMVSGLYFSRKSPVHPVIYERCGLDAETLRPVAEAPKALPEAEIFPVEAVGFGAVLVSAGLLRRVIDRFGEPFTPIPGFGEDLSFCLRVRELGETVWCDRRVKPGHVGIYTYTHNDWGADS